jgi:hypothetical protein
MPPKKKRRMREHPHVEQWVTISTLSQDIARLTKQQQQYVALLLQISELTQHNQNVPDNPWSGDQIDFKDVTDYILSWLDDFDVNQQECKQQRDNALTDLKNSDVSDDNALKRLAAALTEAEINLKMMDNFAVKWKKIVRFEKGSLREHTEKWLKRWLKQWESTNTTKSQRLLKFQEALILVSQESVMNSTSTNPNM